MPKTLMKSFNFQKSFALVSCLLSATAARADITFAPIFGDHMVVQRDALHYL